MEDVKRPWGLFKTFALNKKCTVKILEVSPNQKLSLQKHKRRKELWYFLTDGRVEVGDSKLDVKAGEEILIGKNVPHRLIAKKTKVKVLEVSFGRFNEKDEVRLEDDYGRK